MVGSTQINDNAVYPTTTLDMLPSQENKPVTGLYSPYVPKQHDVPKTLNDSGLYPCLFCPPRAKAQSIPTDLNHWSTMKEDIHQDNKQKFNDFKKHCFRAHDGMVPFPLAYQKFSFGPGDPPTIRDKVQHFMHQALELGEVSLESCLHLSNGNVSPIQLELTNMLERAIAINKTKPTQKSNHKGISMAEEAKTMQFNWPFVMNEVDRHLKNIQCHLAGFRWDILYRVIEEEDGTGGPLRNRTALLVYNIANLLFVRGLYLEETFLAFLGMPVVPSSTDYWVDKRVDIANPNCKGKSKRRVQKQAQQRKEKKGESVPPKAKTKKSKKHIESESSDEESVPPKAKKKKSKKHIESESSDEESVPPKAKKKKSKKHIESESSDEESVPPKAKKKKPKKNKKRIKCESSDEYDDISDMSNEE